MVQMPLCSCTTAALFNEFQDELTSPERHDDAFFICGKFLVLTQCQNVTDRQADERTDLL